MKAGKIGAREGVDMFREDVLEQDKALKEQWQRRCVEMYGEQEFIATTASGIPVKPVYTPLDIGELSYDEMPLPGQFPYTRGSDPLGYQVQPWLIRLAFGFGSGKDTRERWEYLRRLGGAGRVGREAGESVPFRIVPDQLTQRGYDPDEPEARGRVGACGTSFSTIKDMEMIFENVPLENTRTNFVARDASLVLAGMYIAYAKKRAVALERLFLQGSNLLYKEWNQDNPTFPPRYAIRLMVELIKYWVDNHWIRYSPRVSHTTLAGYQVAECGGNAIQEVALTLATAMTVTEECSKAGLEPDDVVPGFYSMVWAGMDFFESIAKMRAWRKLWAKIFEEKFGCKRSESLQCNMMPQVGGTQLIAQEPLNNIVRATLMTLACVLSGVDGIFTTSYDEPLCVPTEEAVRIAMRTQQIIYHETNIPNVADPLGGSYYMEWLTNKIEEEVVKYLRKIDELGGYIKCWESGWIRRELERSANDRQRKIDSGEIVIVGQNKYRLPDELQPKVSVLLYDPKVEEETIARVRKFREERDNERVRASLARVREAAMAIAEDWPRSCGVLMPAIIEAAGADATVGEMQKILQEVFGYVYTS